MIKTKDILNLLVLLCTSFPGAQTPTIEIIHPNRLALSRIKAELPEINNRRADLSLNPLTTRKIREFMNYASLPDFKEIEYQFIVKSEGLSKKSINKSISKLAEALPAYIDNSILPGFPEIRNQSTWGACGAFSLAYYLYTHEISLITGWDNTLTDNTTVFSPSWLFNHSGNGMAVTGTLAYSIFSRHGAATWTDFSYDTTSSDSIAIRVWPTNPDVWLNALQYKAEEYGELFGWQMSENPDLLKTLLINGHVLSITCYIDQWEYARIKDDGIPSVPDSITGEWAATKSGGSYPVHSMTIVGYNDSVWVDINGNSIIDAGERGAFKVANSYGTEWKNKGFIWVAYDALHEQSKVAGVASDDTRKMIFTKCCWIFPPRIKYTPLLSFGVTLSTPDRSQLKVAIGRSKPGYTVPDTLIPLPYFNFNGDHFSVDGTKTASHQKFFLDLTDLIIPDETCSYYLKFDTRESTCTVSDIALYDNCSGEEIQSSSPMTTISKNSSQTFYLDCLLAGLSCRKSATGKDNISNRKYHIAASNCSNKFFTLLGQKVPTRTISGVTSQIPGNSLSSSLYIKSNGEKLFTYLKYNQ